jgi:hypothetical protein
MKKSLFLAMAISMGLIIGCGDSSSSTSPDTNSGDDSRIVSSSSKGSSGKSSSSNKKSSSSEAKNTTTVSAFFPEGYDANKVVAWYASDMISETDNGQTKSFVEAAYLFEDGSFLATNQTIKTKNKVSTYENSIAIEGTWEGKVKDFANASVTIHTDEFDMPIVVKKGKFTITEYEDVSLTFSLVDADVPEADVVTKKDKDEDSENPDGTEEQLEWAKTLIERSKSKASTIAEFEISEPKWEKNKRNDRQYLATYTIKVTLSEGEFFTDTDDLEYPPLAIGQYPVHAIKSDKDNLPEQWNNNDWEIKDAKVVGKTMTATMTEKIDNLKVGRAYVFVSKNKGMDLSIQYSEAFFIVPPGSEDALK